MTASPRDRIVAALAASQSPLRAEGVALCVDQLLAQRVCDLLELHDLYALALTAVTRESVERIVNRHVRPGFARYAEAVPSSEARVGDLVSEPARAALRDIAAQLQIPRARWARGAIDPDLLRKLLGPVWVQVLLNFAKRIAVPAQPTAAAAAPASAGRGIASMLGRSVQQRAGRLVDAGRSVIETLGIDVEKRLLTTAREFSDTAVSVWTSAMHERFASEEGRALLAQLHVGVVDHVLRTRFSELQADVAALPVDAVLELAPELCANAVRSGFVQEILKRELSAYWELEHERTLGALLEDFGILAEVRALFLARGDEVLAKLATTPAFGDWLERLLRT